MMLRYGLRRAIGTTLNSRLQLFLPKRTSVGMTTSGDPEKDYGRLEAFLRPDVQKLLKELTGRDYSRIFRNRKIGQKLKEPRISFMTVKDLEEAVEQTEERADYLLQMPPVLPPAKDDERILSFDPRIQGHDPSAFVFTDISLNCTNRERLMVTRELDGTLKFANRRLRMKLNNIYFPTEAGRELTVPKMFSQPEVLKAVLDRASEDDNTYEFVLDRACVQFDPDDPQYISVVEATYEHIDEMSDYDYLKSTRHYGPLVFYLTRKRKMDNLLIFNIQHERIQSDAVPLVNLFALMFPECKSKEILNSSRDDVDKLRSYIQLDSIRRTELELSLNAYLEIKESRESVGQGMERAHGF